MEQYYQMLPQRQKWPQPFSWLVPNVRQQEQVC